MPRQTMHRLRIPVQIVQPLPLPIHQRFALLQAGILETLLQGQIIIQPSQIQPMFFQAPELI